MLLNMKNTKVKLWTAKDAAAHYGVSEARIRQICIEHDIGTVRGTTRILMADDMMRLKAIRKKTKVYKKTEKYEP